MTLVMAVAAAAIGGRMAAPGAAAAAPGVTAFTATWVKWAATAVASMLQHYFHCCATHSCDLYPSMYAVFCRLPSDELHGHVACKLQLAFASVLQWYMAQYPLRADPHAMIYTDGSVIQSNLKELETTGSKRIRLETTTATIAGAGKYIPRALVTDDLMSRLNDEASNAAFQSCGDEHTDGDPGGEGATNTITRAEGAAIWYALREGLGTAIATDSAAVLYYQIRNMLHRPAPMQHCKNKALIQKIVDFIRASPHHIHLQKVTAHTGIPGNELADEAASTHVENSWRKFQGVAFNLRP
jgi:ribonuclease HI